MFRKLFVLFIQLNQCPYEKKTREEYMYYLVFEKLKLFQVRSFKMYITRFWGALCSPYYPMHTNDTICIGLRIALVSGHWSCSRVFATSIY